MRGPAAVHGEFAVVFFPPHLKRRIRKGGNVGKCWGVAFQVNELVMTGRVHMPSSDCHGVDEGSGF